MKDSPQEIWRLDGRHEQAQAIPLPRDDMVRLQRCAPEARVLLTWLDKETAWLAPHERRPPIPSSAAIRFGLSIKVLPKLPLRRPAPMFTCLLRLAGLEVGPGAWSVRALKMSFCGLSG